MGRSKTKGETAPVRKLRPALSPEARENQLIALAVDLAERQLLEGTASSQVITHYLKLGTAKERLEREKLEAENEMIKAKTKAIGSTEELAERYSKALDAMRRYSGHGEDSEDEY